MLLLKIAAVVYPIVTLIISILFVKLLKLNKRGWNFADLAFPMFAFEFIILTDKLYYSSLLPHLLLALSLLLLILLTGTLYKKRELDYKRFFQVYWRAGFLLTFLMYIGLLVAIFTQK